MWKKEINGDVRGGVEERKDKLAEIRDVKEIEN